MARRRKPGRPKGSKNKKRSKTKARRKSKATPAQLRNLKKARAARAKNLKKASKKTVKKRGRKSATYHKRVENLKKARAAREMKRLPKTRRMALKQLQHDMMADTVRVGISPKGGRYVHSGHMIHIPASAPSILHRVRRHMPTLVSHH
jgi:hypothetical protein